LRASSFFTYIHREHSNLSSKPDAMRYQDWDILLYPKDCEVPFKEFKTTCYAVQEGGSASGNGTSTSFEALDDCPNSLGLADLYRSADCEAFAHLLRAWSS
jgi:hypothetical protein